jgi:lipoprotein-anchoring transpeptidase ErfK/SrfK
VKRVLQAKKGLVSTFRRGVATARSRTSQTRRQTPQDRRRRRAKPRRARGTRVLVALVLIAIAALPFGALAWADHDGRGRIPSGTKIGGVDVGGLDATTAIKRLRAQIGIPASRAVKVSVDDDTPVTLPASRAGMHLNLRAAVDRAVERGRRGSFLTRGWRELTGAKLAAAEPVRIRVDRDAVKRFVAGLAAEVAVPAQSASFSISVDSVGVTDGHDGKQLADQDALVDRLVHSLRSLRSTRRLHAKTEVVKPAASDTSLWDTHPTVVTVSRAEKLARVFDHGQVVKSYHVAVGMDEYPTPLGTFTVQTMQKDPVWNVPDSDWAGDLAGKTIPGGDPANPLKARFIGFNGSVGFHGTSDLSSLGSAASHGCVRMDPADVKDLFERVSVGTTVFVG